MRPWAIAMSLSLGIGIALSAACGSSERERGHAVEAGARGAADAHEDAPDASKATDAALGPADARAEVAAGGGELDLHALLIAALIETEGSLVARCPCLTASGVYDSMRACSDAVTFGRNWIDCVNGLDLTTEDDPEVRTNLHCNIRELKQRSECLRGSSCSDDDVVRCMSQTLDCPKLPLELLSQVAVECQIAFSR